MRSFMCELARIAGKIALDHYHGTGFANSTTKGRGDYVTFVDRRIEDVLVTRIRTAYPDHAIVAEEGHRLDAREGGPCWIIDPIDGTTNFIRGIPAFVISIAFCDQGYSPRYGVIYDPVRDECFYAERDAGAWLGQERIYSSGHHQLREALLATSLPFRHLGPLDDAVAVLRHIQHQGDDFRRSGSCALDLAYVAAGRLDGFWELGIWAWDTAAGELMVRCAGGQCSDYRGDAGALLTRRSIVAGATPELHAELLAAVAPMRPWLEREPFIDHLAVYGTETSGA